MQDETQDRHHHRKGIGADLILPLMAAAYAAYYVYTIIGYPPEARYNGTFIAIAIWILVAILLVRTAIRLWRGEVTLRMTGILAPASKLPTRLGFIGLTALNIVLVEWLGFTLTVVLFLLSSMCLLGVRSAKALAIIPLLAGGLGYLFFIVLLDTRLPQGPVEWLLQWLF